LFSLFEHRLIKLYEGYSCIRHILNDSTRKKQYLSGDLDDHKFLEIKRSPKQFSCHDHRFLWGRLGHLTRLASSDFFSCSYLEGIVYKNNPYSLEQFDDTMNNIEIYSDFPIIIIIIIIFLLIKHYSNCYYHYTIADGIFIIVFVIRDRRQNMLRVWSWCSKRKHMRHLFGSLWI